MRRPTRTARPAVAVLLSALGLGAASCGSDDTATAPGPTSSTPTSAPSSLAPSTTSTTDALTLTFGDEDATCFSPEVRDVRDYGFYGVQWRSNTDLESVRFRVRGTGGVRVVKPLVSVPPRNFGGRIDTGGLVTWAGRATSLDGDPAVVWAEHRNANQASPTAGETGLLLVHLRFGKALASGEGRAALHRVSATYTTADGASGVVGIPLHETFRYAGDRAC